MNNCRHILYLIFLIFCFLSAGTPIFSEQPKIPTNDILEVWEHSCIKHLEKGDINRALKVLKVMNWQCDTKKALAFKYGDFESLDDAIRHLEEAREVRIKYLKGGKRWICYHDLFHSQTKALFSETIGKIVFKSLHGLDANDDVTNIVIAQIALETSWGKRLFGNNLFDIKGKYNGESVSFTTHEQLSDGSWIKITDAFRKYPTIEDSVSDYIRLLKTKWQGAYKALFSSDKDAVEKFISGLRPGETGGYATDKLYVQKLRSLYEQVKSLLTGQSVFPTYLKCLGREDELQQILGRKQ